MIDPEKIFPNPKSPNKELPKIGQRVLVLCVKELIYAGNCHGNASDWKDDGDGYRAIALWDEI